MRATGEQGFTLVELMVVVMIIAILIAVAVPSFLGARERSQDRAAQGDLRNALTAGKVLYVDQQSYAGLTEADLEGIEPNLDFDALASASTSLVGFSGPSADTVVYVKQSRAGDFFCIAEDVSGPGITFGSAAALANVDTPGECTGGW